MKNKSKVRFRIGAMCLIALFILIPLFSSPVSAVVTWGVSVGTDNTATGPRVYLPAACPTPGFTYSLADDGSGSLTISCKCYCCDRRTTAAGGTGSDHVVELNVQRVQPTIGSINTVVFQCSLPAPVPPTTITTPASGYPTTISVTVTYTAGGLPTDVFMVWVYAWCYDKTSDTSVWNTWYWYVRI